MILILNLIILAECVVLPIYKINLTDTETIEIFKNPDDDETEMISSDVLQKYNIGFDDSDLSKIHRVADQRNSIEENTFAYNSDKKIFLNNISESYFDVREPKIQWAGLIGKTNIEQRETYDYYSMRDEYFNAENLNSTKELGAYNATGKIKPTDELLKEVLRIKNDTNCKSNNLIGTNCIKKVISSKNKHFLLKRLWNIGMLWLLIYVFIGVPLWCQKGWCCCCCRCKFCKPEIVIDEAKSFYIRNPPGTLIDAENNIIRYEPTKTEEITLLKLKQAILHA